MNTRPELNRRQFLQTTALAVSALPFVTQAAELPLPGKGRIKVGCLSWCFHDFSPAVDPEPAIDIIGELGFDGIELILTARNDIKGFWTDARIDRFKQKLERNKLRVSQFVMFQPVVEGLSSTATNVREQNLDYFEAGCRIGRKLEAPMVNIVAPWARELKGPDSYLPRYYELEHAAPGQKFHIDIAEGFDWERVWQAYVETTKACLARAKAHGLRFSIEQHTHTLVPEAASFLRLWDGIRDPGLGYNLDAGWTQLQREYPPVAIHKVGKHLMNLHMRDIDGLMRRFVHIGEEVMDFKAIVAALKGIGFDGFASLEQDKLPGDMRETCQRYLRMMREYIG
ncbi:MAG: sugar phosphate isomerase/epimerase family protein [Limisphaerales bacterium]